MTDEQLDAIALAHLDAEPAVLARLRQDPESAAVLDALDRVTAALKLFGDNSR